MKSLPMKQVYTTSEVARLCHVTPKTVINWIETGKLECMKTGGGFRKIFRKELIRFMKANNIPFENITKKILIIDDDPVDVHVMKEILQSAEQGYHLDHAYDGEEGLFKIGVVNPDLVILDIMMPGLDGFKVHDLIKKTPATTDIRVLFITGLDKNECVRRFNDHGIQSFLFKPFTPQELMAKVSSALGGSI